MNEWLICLALLQEINNSPCFIVCVCVCLFPSQLSASSQIMKDAFKAQKNIYTDIKTINNNNLEGRFPYVCVAPDNLNNPQQAEHYLNVTCFSVIHFA